MRRPAPPSLLKAIDANNYFGVIAELQKLSASGPSALEGLVDDAGHSVLLRSIFGFGWPAPMGVAMTFGGPTSRLSPHYSRPSNLAALRGLLDGGVSPALLMDEALNRTLLHSTIIMCRPTESLLLMAYMDKKLITVADINGITALHLATERGLVRVVSALVGLTDIPSPSTLAPALVPVDLDDGVIEDLPTKEIPSRPCQCYINPNTVTKAGAIPLSLAIRQGSVPVIDALLAAGANPNQKFFTGAAAVMEGYTEGRHCLHMAIMARNLGAVKSLLAAGADANAHTPTKYYALNFAIDVRQVAMVEALLAAGADPNAAGKSGHTPLYCAADRGLPEAAQLLLDHGAQTTNAYVPDMCPIDIACFRGHAPCFFEALVPNVPDINNRLPELALRTCQGGHTGLLEALLQKGLPVTSELLQEACTHSPEMVRLLFDQGGDLADCSIQPLKISCPGVLDELARQGMV